MPKKARAARRDARFIETELCLAEARIKSLESACTALREQVRAANAANQRLSAGILRTQLRDADTFVVQVKVDRMLLDEFRYERDYYAGMLGEQIAREFERASCKRLSDEPIFAKGGVT